MDTKLGKPYKENPKLNDVLHGLNGNIKIENSPQVTRVKLQLF